MVRMTKFAVARAARAVPPASLEEAEARRLTLVSDIQRIQAQLASRNRTEPTGERVSKIKYSDWRQRSVHAIACLTKDLRELKAWIRDRRMADALTGGLPRNPDPMSLLRVLHSVVRRIAARTVLTPEEKAVLDGVATWLQFKAPVRK